MHCYMRGTLCLGVLPRGRAGPPCPATLTSASLGASPPFLAVELPIHFLGAPTRLWPVSVLPVEGDVQVRGGKMEESGFGSISSALHTVGFLGPLP